MGVFFNFFETIFLHVKVHYQNLINGLNVTSVFPSYYKVIKVMIDDRKCSKAINRNLNYLLKG